MCAHIDLAATVSQVSCADVIGITRHQTFPVSPKKNIVLFAFFILRQPHPTQEGEDSGQRRQPRRELLVFVTTSTPTPAMRPAALQRGRQLITVAFAFCAVPQRTGEATCGFTFDDLPFIFRHNDENTYNDMEGGWCLNISYEQQHTRKSHNISNRSALDKYLHALPEQSIC